MKAADAQRLAQDVFNIAYDGALRRPAALRKRHAAYICGLPNRAISWKERAVGRGSVGLATVMGIVVGESPRHAGAGTPHASAGILLFQLEEYLAALR